MFDVHVPHPYQDAGLSRFQMFGNGHRSIAQRWKAGGLLLHQSRAANKFEANWETLPTPSHYGQFVLQ